MERGDFDLGGSWDFRVSYDGRVDRIVDGSVHRQLRGSALHISGRCVLVDVSMSDSASSSTSDKANLVDHGHEGSLGLKGGRDG